jgi:hypothetical protein
VARCWCTRASPTSWRCGARNSGAEWSCLWNRMQYFFFCTSKASKLSTFCTSKASKLSTCVSICTFVLVKPVNWAHLVLGLVWNHIQGARSGVAPGTQFTGFTSTKVQILTQVLSLLALLVQKYRYWRSWVARELWNRQTVCCRSARTRWVLRPHQGVAGTFVPVKQVNWVPQMSTPPASKSA